MALRFADSFDHYTTPSLKWSNINVSAQDAGFNIGAFGRFSTSGGRKNNGAWQSIGKTLDVRSTWIAGVAFYIASISGKQSIIGFFDGTSNQVDVCINGSGVLEFRRNKSVLNTGSHALSAATFYYIELKATIDNTTGSYEVRINGATEFTGSSTDTQQTGNASANMISIGDWGSESGPESHFDDFYICDTSGATNNNFLGDVRVECLFPNGNGNYSQFTGSDGNSTDNYLLVDETSPNGDTDYVADATVSDKDTYTFTDPTPTSGSVYGVQITHYSRKTSAGTRSSRSLARLSGTDADNGSDQALATSYTYFSDIRETKPGGGSWSLSDVANAEFGVEVAA